MFEPSRVLFDFDRSDVATEALRILRRMEPSTETRALRWDIEGGLSDAEILARMLALGARMVA